MKCISIAAQVLGVIGVLIFVIMYHSKNVNNVLKKKFYMDIVWAAHYFLIGGYTACATNVICGAREIIFMNNDKTIFKNRFWLILFIVLNWVSGILMWNGVYCLIPALVSTFATYSFWQKNINIARVIALFNNICMFIYDIFVSSYMGMVGETITFFSIIFAIIMSKKTKLKN